MTLFSKNTFHAMTLLFLLVLTTSCTSSQVAKESITGKWLITTTSDNQYLLSISHLDNNVYLITADEVQISGQYRFKDDTLTLIKSNIPSISKAKFSRLINGNWKIVEAPPAFRIRVQLIDAEISRD